MAQDWEAFPSGTSTGKNSAAGTYVDPNESIGRPRDAPATDVADENSAFSLLKGIAANFGAPVGVADSDINDAAKLYHDPLLTLGEMTDPPATDTGRWSAISLMKGIASNLGLP